MAEPRPLLVRAVPVRRLGPRGPAGKSEAAGEVPSAGAAPRGGESLRAERHSVAVEAVVDLVLNGRRLARVACLPVALEDLALGFLVTEGLVDGPEAVEAVVVPPGADRVEVRAVVDPDRIALFLERAFLGTGCGGEVSAAGPGATERNASRPAAPVRFRPEDLAARMREMASASALFRQTGCVHAAAVTDGRRLLAFAEDIGRLGAVDKAVGRSLRQGVDPGTAALLVTGRATGEVVGKAVRAGLPAVVSRSAVSARAVDLARAARLTLAGFARGRRMNVYTAAWRLGLEPERRPDTPPGPARAGRRAPHGQSQEGEASAG